VSEQPADVSGPIDYLLIEFPADRLTGRVAPALADLVESGTIRLYDVMVISKGKDGTVSALAMEDVGGETGFEYFAGASTGLLGDDDLRSAAEALEPGTVAALIVYENTWAVPFVIAARESGGELVASGRIPATDVMAALDAVEAAAPIPS
jgi:dihydroorotase-like cyclic amidohydrolase